MTFEAIGYEENPTKVLFLPKQQAIDTHRVITGLMAAKREGVDIEKLPDNEVYKKAWEIGRGETNLNSAI